MSIGELFIRAILKTYKTITLYPEDLSPDRELVRKLTKKDSAYNSPDKFEII